MAWRNCGDGLVDDRARRSIRTNATLGDGWPNLPRKCQPNTSLRSGEIKHFAVFSERQPDISGFVPRMAIYWE